MKFRYFKLLLLPVLPIVYVILAGIFFVYWRPYYIIGPDPVYSYLFTGMTLANGNLEIGYIDHPGITVQCFSAAVIYIQHLFSHGNRMLYQDVIMHPESYLYGLCVAFGILYALVTLATGYYVYKKTENIVTALLFQITPLLGKEILSGSSPSPESFMLICGLPFIAYIYCNSIFAGPHNRGKTTLKTILIYGAFSGFMVATKYTCLPLCFLVLFLLPGVKPKIKYIGAFTLFFLVFISPALPALKSMWNWIINLATHTGQYGQGDEGILNKSEFLANIGNIFNEDRYFTLLYILLSIALFIAILKRGKPQSQKAMFMDIEERKQVMVKSNIYTKLFAGLWVSSTLLILLVAKHYSFHYLIPVRLCYPLIIAGSYGVFRDVLNLKVFKNKVLFQILFYAFFVCLILGNLRPYLTNPPRPFSTATSTFLNGHSDIPLVITSEFGSSRLEPALEIGTTYTRDFHNKYWEYMKTLYPNSYRYTHPGNILTHWDEVTYTPELFTKYPEILVYFNDKDSGTRATMLNELCIWVNDTIASRHLVYFMKESGEYVYELTGNQNKAKALMANPSEVKFDFEKLNTDKSKFVSMDGIQTMYGVKNLSNKEHHSGNNSIFLTKDNGCTPGYFIHAIPGNIIKISVWCKSEENRNDIVFSTEKGGDFYFGGHGVVDSDINGWKKLEYKCLVPPIIKDGTIKFFIYYYGHTHAYYDDLTINVFPMKLNNSTFAKKDSIL